MEEKELLPKGFYKVTLQLDYKVTTDGHRVPICSDEITQEMDLGDYISLMWKLKTMAFVPFWNRVINKMHIVDIESTLSPHIVMSIWNFINEQRIWAFDLWKSREELYNEWCDWLSERYEANREALSPNQDK